ncbi:Protein stu1 [Gossypium arboreum]|uniref:Protein stu1 n=1 Tax=Gossypium arboreum TaxID=29729 RepID=A0A0B0N8I0_GOSAR|nr:Protein stu1 [Gossypium arboreum]
MSRFEKKKRKKKEKVQLEGGGVAMASGGAGVAAGGRGQKTRGSTRFRGLGEFKASLDSGSSDIASHYPPISRDMGVLHDRVSPGVKFETKSVRFTWPHTRACDLAVWHKSVYPIGLARPSTRACVAISKGTWARHTGMWLAM